jgi:hypothetical protein
MGQTTRLALFAPMVCLFLSILLTYRYYFYRFIYNERECHIAWGLQRGREEMGMWVASGPMVRILLLIPNIF